MARKSVGRKKAAKRAITPFVEAMDVPTVPIKHWSHSSLMAFLRNPLAWYKRYVENVRDTPSNPSSVVGRAGHLALQHFYSGLDKEGAVALGLEYMRSVSDFEIEFGKAKSKKARREKREQMERDYLQAVGFYLEKPPKHDVLGVEVVALAEVDGHAIPLKAISDLVIRSKIDKNAVDIVDHKFVAAFSKQQARKTLFVMQAIFNYYTVKQLYKKEVRQFIVYECKKTRNADSICRIRRTCLKAKTHSTSTGSVLSVSERLSGCGL
ncbi:PD-(D/E)XK nuclease family protein [Candidatus Kaiserbacteria bacterium]|nr:PD-(D/E)XK nuclease family protein [Candidatus Kaiserbacteria bacterium]